MTRRYSRRIVYQATAYAPYMVPIYDALYDRIGEDFLVLSHKPLQSTDPTRMATSYEQATRMGRFPRLLINHRSLPYRLRISRNRLVAEGTTVAPSLPRTLYSLNPACVISSNFNTWSLTSLVLGYPTIPFWEGWSHTESSIGRSRTAMRRWMAAHASGWVAQGRLARKYLASLGVPEAQIHTPGLCHSPPPRALRESSRNRRRTLRTVRFLCVARLIRGKGIDHLLHATAALARRVGKGVPFELVIVGDGPDRPRLTKLVAELALQHRVRLAGYVSPSDIWEQYAGADVFVLPTLKDNWPLCVAEAMSMGLPALVSHFAGSVADLVHDEENGHTFDPMDHEALCELMLGYVNDSTLVSTHGERSIDLIAPYTPESIADSILNAVQGILSPRSNSLLRTQEGHPTAQAQARLQQEKSPHKTGATNELA